MIRLTASFFVVLLAAAPTLGAQVDRQAAWQQHQKLAQESPFRSLEWRAVGPVQQGGRIEAIAVHPTRPNTFYVGPGSGNLWKTTNGGLRWTPIFENESTFSIGDIAIAPSNPDIVWVGTGETQPRHSGYSFAGTGVFRSLDAGKTWQNMGLWDTHHIGKVVIHPRDPNIVLVAAIGPFWSRNAARGVFRTQDGGKTWRKVLFVSDRTGVVDLAMDPSDPQHLYAAAWQVTQGEESGLYRSTDGGLTWTRMTKGLPTGATGRAGLAVSASQPRTVYAFVDNHAKYTPPPKAKPRRGNRRAIMGGEVYRSDDRGDTWRKVNVEDLYQVFTIFGWKFCDIRVHPKDVDEVFILGNRAFHSRDGGKTFQRIGEDILRLHDTRGEAMHLDHHELWIDPASPDRLLLGNDGGLFESRDRGRSWLHINNLPIGEFYFVHADQGEPYTIYGGTQDNAALFGPATAIEPFKNDPWRHVFLDIWTGGDAFVTLPDPTRPNIVYYEHQHGAMREMDLRGSSILSWGKAARSIRPRPPRGERWRFGWYTPFLISHHDPKTLLVGANKVLQSKDRGRSWQAISPDVSDPAGGERAVVPVGTITMLTESRKARGLIYCGTESGAVHVTRDGGETWREVGHGGKLPRKWVTRVVASRHVESRVYVAMSGFRSDDFASYLFVSEDYGGSWRSIVANLPAESINVVREDPERASILYLGTDLGVYVSRDRGKSWQSLRGNLPTTPVHDLVIQEQADEIILGTHGRSVFVASVSKIRAAK